MITFKGVIPITIYPLFFLLSFVIALVNADTVPEFIAWILIVFVSVLVHEYGHALTANLFGQKARIELVGMGGLTIRNGSKLARWKDFLVIFNGPLFGLLLGILAFELSFFLKDHESLLYYALAVTFKVNLFWTVLNLIPVQPLDGGHLLTLIFEGLFGYKGLKFSLLLSALFALVMALLFFQINFIVAILFLIFASESWRIYTQTKETSIHDQNDQLKSLLDRAKDDLLSGRRDQALQELETILHTAKEGVIWQSATEALANLLYQAKEYREAFQHLLPVKSKLSGEGIWLLHQIAFQLGEWNIVKDLSSSAFQAHPYYDTAFINALCYAHLGKVEEALGWLGCSKREGHPNLKEELKRSEFDPIRQDPSFVKWEALLNS